MEIDSGDEDQVQDVDYDEEDDDDDPSQMSQIEENQEQDMSEAEVWRDTSRSFPPLLLPDRLGLKVKYLEFWMDFCSKVLTVD